MNLIQLSKLNEEIKCGYKILRGYSYDAKSKRLTLTLGSHEGLVKSTVIERATEPQELSKWIGHEIYGVRVYYQVGRGEVHMDFGPTVTFSILDGTENKPPRQKEKP